MRLVVAIVLGFFGLIAAFAAALFLAGSFNFGYEPQPEMLLGAAFAGGLALAAGGVALSFAGAQRNRIVYGVPVVVIAVFFAYVTVAGLLELRTGGASAASLELIGEVPPFPGAHSRVHVDEVAPDGDMFGEGFLNQGGEVTERVDVLPSDADVFEAEEYYRTAMRTKRWRVRSFEDRSGYDPSKPPNLGFQIIGRRGDALLEVVIWPNPPSPLRAYVSGSPTGNEMCGDRPSDDGCW